MILIFVHVDIKTLQCRIDDSLTSRCNHTAAVSQGERGRVERESACNVLLNIAPTYACQDCCIHLIMHAQFPPRRSNISAT